MSTNGLLTNGDLHVSGKPDSANNSPSLPPIVDGGIGRSDVVAYLRWLADQPGGIEHRGWLFHAAHIIRRDAQTVFVDVRDSRITKGADGDA